MSSIIKSFSVVDPRFGPDPQFLANEADNNNAVLKRQALSDQTFAASIRYIPPKDAYLEELNKIRVDLAEAQKELSTMNRLIVETREDIAALEVKRAELEKMEGLSIDDEAIQMLQQAENDAEKIRRKARDDCAGIAEEFKTQGYLQGLEEGANEARQKVWEENKPQIEALSILLEDLSNIKGDLVRQSESEIVELILAIAEKVVGAHIKETPQAVVDMLRDVLEQNRREEYIKIIVSKDLMPAVAKVSDQVKEIITTLAQQVDILVDSEGLPGGLMVETTGGYTDLSVDTQLRNIGDTLHEAAFGQPE